MIVAMGKDSASRAIVAILALAALLVAAPAAAASGKHRHHGPNHVIFVHGGAGSGAQFESQAMRLTSNGYRARQIHVLEYDSTFGLNTMDQVHAKLDALIAEVKAKSRRPKVDVLGHSLGTTVMHGYLATPARAANVAHYVNIDGRTGTAPPGGVPTLAIWAGRGAPGREIVGATNVTIPNQTHVEVATSKESFVEIFEFFTGRRPRHDIRREHGWIELAGRASLFPQNTGVGEATLAVWEVDRHSGHREHRRPLAVRSIAGDGAWGPIRVKAGRRYELTLFRAGAAPHHFYYEPFPRDDHLVRLLTSVPGQGLDLLAERSDAQSNLVVTRNKELWGDQGAQSDVLELNDVNVLNAATAPIAKRVIGMFAFDRGTDRVTDLSAPIPAFFALPFLSGVDVFMPAHPRAKGEVEVRLRSRGSRRERKLDLPNFPSTTDRVTAQFHDFE
jgi:pimeloyl-ACP methyl ester carboxylesterase